MLASVYKTSPAHLIVYIIINPHSDFQIFRQTFGYSFQLGGWPVYVPKIVPCAAIKMFGLGIPPCAN